MCLELVEVLPSVDLQFLPILKISFFKYFLSTTSLLSFRDSNYMYIGLVEMSPYLTDALFTFLISFFSLYLVLIFFNYYIEKYIVQFTNLIFGNV